ncbi:winged helix-turn-helix domain-containing protein [Schaalia suimastitidis]|uniref:winged helix-turn-helix domain-containing protein n=1 Tax=Schaalia suimastitidis TaxID=121163 RepID=UPI0003F55C02|nr:winged helix-turn-helix domain-containing protein [Schaalia suimastitidis]
MTLVYTPETTATCAEPTSFDAFLAVLDGLRLSSVRVDLDLDNHVVRIGGKVVALCNKEYELLTHLAARCDRAVSREELFETVWHGSGLSADNSRTVDAHIRRLRAKLATPDLISTVRGQGYRFNSAADVRVTLTPVHTLAA